MTPRGCPSFVTWVAVATLLALVEPRLLAVGSLVLTVLVGTRERA